MPKTKKKKKTHLSTTLETPTPPKKKTLKQRIDEVVDKYEDKDELKKGIFRLVQRVLYPEQFCPECDDRLFYTATTNSYDCPNCGYQSTQEGHTTGVQPRRTLPSKVPKQVEQIIKQAESVTRKSPRTTSPTKRGKSIRELVDQMDGVGVPPTKDDEDRVKQDPNVGRDINWV